MWIRQRVDGVAGGLVEGDCGKAAFSYNSDLSFKAFNSDTGINEHYK